MSKNNNIAKPSYSKVVYNLLIEIHKADEGMTIGELGNPAPQTMQKLRAKKLVRIQKIETGKRGRPAYRYFLTADGKRSAQRAIKRQKKAEDALEMSIEQSVKVAKQTIAV